MIWTGARKWVQEDADNPGKQSPEVGQDLANIVAATAEDGEEGVTKAVTAAERQKGSPKLWNTVKLRAEDREFS